jgi:hypothetical protein
MKLVRNTFKRQDGHYVDRQAEVILKVEQSLHDNVQDFVRVLHVNRRAQIYALGILTLVYGERRIRVARAQKPLKLRKGCPDARIFFAAVFFYHRMSPPAPQIASTNCVALLTARATCRSFTCAGS